MPRFLQWPKWYNRIWVPCWSSSGSRYKDQLALSRPASMAFPPLAAAFRIGGGSCSISAAAQRIISETAYSVTSSTTLIRIQAHHLTSVPWPSPLAYDSFICPSSNPIVADSIQSHTLGDHWHRRNSEVDLANHLQATSGREIDGCDNGKRLSA